jgi:D-alanyl-lipoteichoic acid acyltransferase DltB (MBOAT superfamily)
LALTSLAFLLAFTGFFLLYWLVQGRQRVQTSLLLAAGYAFYAAWDIRMLPLLLILTLINFGVGRMLDPAHTPASGSPQHRHVLLWLGITANLGALLFFKYFDFFAGGLRQLSNATGFLAVEWLLPLGLSFYALQLTAYLVDVYQKRIQPARNLLNFAVFAAFFPQLSSGPIERANHMLPQIAASRRMNPDQLSAGLYLILVGYFKKLVVADNLGLLIVNPIFDEPLAYPGLNIGIGVLAFAIQLYADFSAYSDLARGFARLLGFELVVNFRLPFFARNPTDFWQRWHISLSEWLRDYIFFPVRRATLRFRGGGEGMLALVLPPMITMLVSGLWHGTGWTFLLWGGYHGILMIFYRLLERKPGSPVGGGQPARGSAALLPRLIDVSKVLLMFSLTTLGWLLFRSDSLQQSLQMLALISFRGTSITHQFLRDLSFYAGPLLLAQFWQQKSGDMFIAMKLRYPWRVFLFGMLLAWIFIFGVREASEFIYQQF